MTDKNAKPPSKGESKPKNTKPRERDTRPPNVIWADRAQNVMRLLDRQFGKLAQLGNAKSARPTPEDHAALKAWVEERAAHAIKESGRRLAQAPDAVEEPKYVLPSLSTGARPTPAAPPAEGAKS